MENNYIVLQVRLGSHRLPEKLLLPLKGLTIFEHILKRLSKAKAPKGIIVATTKDTLPFVEDITKKYYAYILTGSEDDVLSRFVDAISTYSIVNVVRATGDNPLVCIGYIDRALELHKKENADLTSFPLLPYGTGIEVIRGEVLKEIDLQTSDPFEKEHITQYIYRHKLLYKIVYGTPESFLQRPDIRLTIDTQADYEKMVDIYEKLYSDLPIKLIDAIKYIDRQVG